VRAGLAVTTLPASMVGEGLRILGPEEGLPELPLTRMGLIHAPGRATEEAKALAEAIRMTVGAPARRAAGSGPALAAPLALSKGAPVAS